MELEERIEQKFNTLITEGEHLKHGDEHGQILNEDHSYSCKRWLTSAQNLVHLVISNPNNPYQASVDKICNTERGFCIQESVGEITDILSGLIEDINQGLLSSVENQTRALVFDDFLDHAKAYKCRHEKRSRGNRRCGI